VVLTELVGLPGRMVRQTVRAVTAAGAGEFGTAGHEARAAGRLATDRVAVTVEGIERADADDLRKALCTAVADLPGVSWTVVNAPLRRLVVGLSDPPPSREQLLQAIELTLDSFPAPTPGREPPEAPDDPGPRQRALTALVADAAGAGLAIVGRVARWVPGSAEAAALVSMVDTQPRVRAAVEQVLGRSRADTVIALSSALAQGLAQGVLGLGTDAALRAGQLSEARARTATW
jgi:cation-transporting P-type ATPase I